MTKVGALGVHVRFIYLCWACTTSRSRECMCVCVCHASAHRTSVYMAYRFLQLGHQNLTVQKRQRGLGSRVQGIGFRFSAYYHLC